MRMPDDAQDWYRSVLDDDVVRKRSPYRRRRVAHRAGSLGGVRGPC